MPFEQQPHVFPGAIGIPGARLSRETKQPIRGASERGYHHDRTARIGLCAGLYVGEGRLSSGANNLDEARDCRLIRDGRAAKLQDKH